MAENGGGDGGGGGGSGGSLPDEQRCKRTDGKKWRCKRQVAPGKSLCENHYLQGHLRMRKEPVPDSLKLERAKRTKRVPKSEQVPTENVEIRANADVGCSNSAPKRGAGKGKGKGKRKMEEEKPREEDQPSVDISDVEIMVNAEVGCSNSVPKRGGGKGKGKRKREEEKPREEDQPSVAISEKLDDALKKMNLKKGDLQLDLIRVFLMRQVEKKKEKQLLKETEKDVVRDLKFGRLEISQASPSSVPITDNNAGLLNVKVGVPASDPGSRRFFRSKNIAPMPIPTVKVAPSVKANIKAAVKNRKKCHWCRMSGYRVFVKCSTCKKMFFCEDCIQERYQDKANIKRECPVCRGTCNCRACKRERSREVKTKEVVVHNAEKKFDKSQQLHYMINLLLPLLEEINEEKIIELDMEAKIKGKSHSQLQIQIALDNQKQRCCSFCKACIVEVHRSCGNCSYVLCIHCCREFREGHLHGGLRDFKYMRTDRRKSLCTILWNWKSSEDGSIKCPPKNLGGCGDGILELRCLSPFSWTKDLEASAKEIVHNYKFTKPLVVDSCSICEGIDKNESEKDEKVLLKNKVLYFSTSQDPQGENLEHFVKHWVRGQPLIIRDVLKSKSELSWDPVFMFCTYLERSAKSQKDKEPSKPKNCSDWCEVEIGRKQIFMGGKTHANVWHEMLKFKVWLSSGIFQEQFPSHHAAVMNALPFQEYINPLTGFLNLATKLPQDAQNPDLGPLIYITYGGPEELMLQDSATKLYSHAYDVVNILAHATECPISEKKLRKVKCLIDKYGSQDYNESSWKNSYTNKIEELFGKSSFNSELTQSGLDDDLNGEAFTVANGEVCLFSDDSTIGESDDEDSRQLEIESSSCRGEKMAVDTRGAHWDIFRRQDVPKLVEYLRKYSSEFNQSYCSPKKVVHPILDESFYLDAFHKIKLKEEFDIEPWTFEQHVGEVVVIPAGCPYQMKKIKSCVNVVLEFVSPESAYECIRLSDELRQLPVNHKAKGKMLEVKKMAIYGINAAIEEIRNLSKAEISGMVKEKA